jgi:hypothetical protein
LPTSKHKIVMKPFFVLFFIFSFCASFSQVKLKNHITGKRKPLDTDSVKQFPALISKTDQKTIGIYLGDTVPQFKLFGIKNDSLDMNFELSKGKPVFLFSGAYTCDMYRSEIGFMDSLSKIFTGISFIVIYVPEPHPAVPDPCPYTNKSWVIYTTEGHLIDQAQPRTYGERKKVVQRMYNEGLISIPIVIDDVYNSWWTNFGPAPNIGYLIQPNGVIKARYFKIRKEHDRIITDLRHLTKKNN